VQEVASAALFVASGESSFVPDPILQPMEALPPGERCQEEPLSTAGKAEKQQEETI
jgi:hypothetical protein